jgi:hypothetical protein
MAKFWIAGCLVLAFTGFFVAGTFTGIALVEYGPFCWDQQCSYLQSGDVK